jgi:hypothetical protein
MSSTVEFVANTHHPLIDAATVFNEVETNQDVLSVKNAGTQGYHFSFETTKQKL